MRNLKRFWVVLWGAALCGWLCAAPLQAQSNTAIIRLDPPNLTVGKGQVEELKIVIDDADDLYGIDFRAEFDPDVIEIVDASADKGGVQLLPGDFLKPDFVVINEADNAKGTLQYVSTQVNPTPPARGSGIVLKILVRAKVQGATSPFHITQVQVANGKGVKLAIEPQDGTVEGVAPKPATPAPTSEEQATPTRAATRAAAAATRVRATAVPSNRVDTPNTDFLTNALLLVIAVGGCLGAFAILGVGFFLVLRKPHANSHAAPPPQFPHG